MGIHFEPTITFGNLLELCTVAVTLIGLYFKIVGRLDKLAIFTVRMWNNVHPADPITTEDLK